MTDPIAEVSTCFRCDDAPATVFEAGDADGWCQPCYEYRQEAAYERSLSDYYGGDGPMHGHLKGESDEAIAALVRLKR